MDTNTQTMTIVSIPIGKASSATVLIAKLGVSSAKSYY